MGHSRRPSSFKIYDFLSYYFISIGSDLWQNMSDWPSPRPLFRIPILKKAHSFRADGFLQYLKYAVLILWMLVAVLVNPEEKSATWEPAFAVASTVVVLVFVIVCVVVSRPFCKYLCPGAVLLGVFDLYWQEFTSMFAATSFALWFAIAWGVFLVPAIPIAVIEFKATGSRVKSALAVVLTWLSKSTSAVLTWRNDILSMNSLSIIVVCRYLSCRLSSR